MAEHLYFFIDEGGNLDFSDHGTKYFTLTCLSKERPFRAYQEITELKYDLIENGINLEYFHASEDSWPVKNKCIDIISKNLQGIRVDSVIIEKRKAVAGLRQDEVFYPKMLGYLIRYVVQQYTIENYSMLHIFTDRIPVNKKRRAIEKAIKITLSEMLPDQCRYKIFHHDSKSNCDLQIADYFNWLIGRKWGRGETILYNRVQKVIKSEFDIFKTGGMYYY